MPDHASTVDRGIVEILVQLCTIGGGEKKGEKDGHQSVPSLSLLCFQAHRVSHYSVEKVLSSTPKRRVLHILPSLPSKTWVKLYVLLCFPVSWSFYPEMSPENLLQELVFWRKNAKRAMLPFPSISCLLAGNYFQRTALPYSLIIVTVIAGICVHDTAFIANTLFLPSCGL